MILTTLLIIGSCAATFFGERKATKLYKKHTAKNSYRARNVLASPAWKEFKRHIVEDCQGYYYSDALVKQVLEQNYRFTCAQIYELRDVYRKKAWLSPKVSVKDYVDKLTQYTSALEIDAEEKVSNILHGIDEMLLLED